jgi:hypothetical protein
MLRATTLQSNIVGPTISMIACQHLPRHKIRVHNQPILSPELNAKRLEIIRDMIPGLSRVTALCDPTGLDGTMGANMRSLVTATRGCAR